MEARCVVDKWAEFHSAASTLCTNKTRLMLTREAHVLLCWTTELHFFNTQHKHVTATLQFPWPVEDLVQSPDEHLLYAACQNGVYCVNLLLLLRFQNSSEDQSSSPAVLVVSSDWLIVKEEGVCSVLLIDGSSLLTLSHRDSLWWFTLYKVTESQQSAERLAQLQLPVVSAGLHDDMEKKKRSTFRRSPPLICVHSSDVYSSRSEIPSSTSPPGDDHFFLEPLLFKLLFGFDAALTKSPVIVCGLPDGRLIFLPMHLFTLHVKVLHSLEQPVVFIATCATSGTAGPQRLVALGSEGRVLVVWASAEGSEIAGKVTSFTEGWVPGPVVCGSVDKDCLYYSRGSDLLVLDLNGRPAERSGQPLERMIPAALQTPISLNVCGVVAMCGPTHNTEDDVQLVGLTSTGRLQRISLPKRSEDGGLPSIPSSHVGQRIRDLLAAIGDVCEKASVLKSSIRSKNQLLRHLNQVLNISCLLLANQDREKLSVDQEQPIRCCAVASWSRMLCRDSLSLTCTLGNWSPFVLESGWMFCVTVSPLSYCLTAGAAGRHNSARTFSFPVKNLHSGGKFEVTLPLTAAEDTSFPVTVSCSLVFSLKSIVREEDNACLLDNGKTITSHLGLDESHVSLLLNTLTVDWLDALQVSKVTNNSFTATSSMNTVQPFLTPSGFTRTGMVKVDAGNPSNTVRPQYSARIRVSSDLLSAALVSVVSDVDPQGSKVTPPSLCMTVLDWLLTRSSAGVEIRPQEDVRTNGSSTVHGRGPGGHPVQLTVKQVTLGEEEKEALTVVELQVESSSMTAVCGLHHAMLHRLQNLLQKAPEKSGSTSRGQDLGLRQALKRAEALLQQIQQSRISEAYGTDQSERKMTQSLLDVYRQLRENPLLIT